MYLFLLEFSSILAIASSEEFIVNNEKCKIPDFPVFSEDVKPYYKKLHYHSCNHSQLLTYTSVENNKAYLHLDRTSLNSEKIDCCYKYVTRKGKKDEPDVGIEYSKCHPFNSTVALEGNIVSVKCELPNKKTFKNAHSPIVITKAVEEKLKKFNKEAKKRPLSVLFMLIDAVSRLNFERQMPLTKKFLLANNFTEFIPYHKVDQNSYPNFIALIAGLTGRQSEEICKPTVVGGLDKCPMIWYDFRDLGYATAYGEDWSTQTTFNYGGKKGFKTPPTDYYFKPYMDAVTKLGTKNYDRMPYCAGPETQDFIINNEKCQIPDFPVFSDAVKPYHTKLNYISCNDSQLLTYTTVENNTAYLHLDRTSLNSETIDCCYKYVTRNGSKDEPDVGVEYSKCHPFNSTVALEGNIVAVQCKLPNNKKFKNAHSPIVITKAVEEKLKKFNKEAKKRPLSVLFMLIDAVSRLNFERQMPLTKKFLLANNFTEFIPYHKIDQNSFPNCIALLAGLTGYQALESCKSTEVGGLDKCPMIWYDFRDLGYATAYGEDWSTQTTFNWGSQKGFKNPPTDYYFKPYMDAVTKLGTKVYDKMPYCAGPETQGERIMNIAKDFSTTFKDQPSFGVFWMNTFSHDRLSSPSRMDEKFKKFVEDLKSEGILDRSMVVVFADHGYRGPPVPRYKDTYQGWYEDRNPMNFISLPKWFQEEYPKKYQNFKDNSKKYTSTYDFYLTLQEILATSVENYTMTGSKACPTCHSFFAEIPDKRSCADAGISYWCSCEGKKN
ncbi:uncharacterized protein LOC114339590 isoform X1 [Diabrotica virgifera virgifera]|uniref:DUF229 domain containing protein n=1 Tax=Diabrotica virgifera virgifera TaxID=50390 RepID=A0ABM5JV30_DIAVI|nr:uncharacterized protein LOC114339590 isoform X1 [Diabrotica virgifera virgifera]